MSWLLLSFIGWRERKSLVSCDKSSSSEKNMRWLSSVSRWGLWWMWPFGSHDNWFSFSYGIVTSDWRVRIVRIPIDFSITLWRQFELQVNCKTALNIICTRRKRLLGSFSTRNLDACRYTFAQTFDPYAALCHRWLINSL